MTLRRFITPLFCLAALLSVSACSCKDWGYCPELFPNAERLADAPDHK